MYPVEWLVNPWLLSPPMLTIPSKVMLLWCPLCTGLEAYCFTVR